MIEAEGAVIEAEGAVIEAEGGSDRGREGRGESDRGI